MCMRVMFIQQLNCLKHKTLPVLYFVILECQFEMTTLNGYLESPSYPGYKNNVDVCAYHIKSLPGCLLKIHFSIFDVEYQRQCSYDSVKVKILLIILCFPILNYFRNYLYGKHAYMLVTISFR